MGRPLNKRNFGANSASNLKVQFFNGTNSVPGFIVKQTGSKRFVCQDAGGTTATCFLVDKASADLEAGEMSITVAFDDGTVAHVTKISGRKMTVSGTQQPWNFSSSIVDERVQVEEAGTNEELTDSIDLEGDEEV